jgi:hypothetical protein
MEPSKCLYIQYKHLLIYVLKIIQECERSHQDNSCLYFRYNLYIMEKDYSI